MSFWETAGKVVAGVGKATYEGVKKYSEEYQASAESYGDRYSRMSDEQLKQEYRSLKNGFTANARNSGRVRALASELKSRGYGN